MRRRRWWKRRSQARSFGGTILNARAQERGIGIVDEQLSQCAAITDNLLEKEIEDQLAEGRGFEYQIFFTRALFVIGRVT